jgi:hypothetical protein
MRSAACKSVGDPSRTGTRNYNNSLFWQTSISTPIEPKRFSGAVANQELCNVSTS